MRVLGLPGNAVRNSIVATRPLAPADLKALQRRDAVLLWRQAMRNGPSAKQAAKRSTFPFQTCTAGGGGQCTFQGLHTGCAGPRNAARSGKVSSRFAGTFRPGEGQNHRHPAPGGARRPCCHRRSHTGAWHRSALASRSAESKGARTDRMQSADGSRKGVLLGRNGCRRFPDSSDLPANRRRNSPGNRARSTSA